MPVKIGMTGISALSGISNGESGGEPEVPDLIPPSATTNLVVTPTLTPSVQLSWDAATDNVSVAGYIVERRSIFKHDVDKFEPDSANGVVGMTLSPQAITSTTSGAALDFGPVYTGVQNYAIQSVGSVSGTSPNCTTKIQESDDGSSWTNVTGATFTAVTQTSKFQIIEFVRTKRYLRSQSTITGVTPSFQINILIGEDEQQFVELVDDVTDLNYKDTTVEEGITYEYRVNAKDPTNNRGPYTDIEQVYVAPMTGLQMVWSLGGSLPTTYTAGSVELTFTGLATIHVGMSPQIYREDGTNGIVLSNTATGSFVSTDDQAFYDSGDYDEIEDVTTPLNPELSTNWFFRLEDAFGNLGVASTKISRHAMIQSAPSSSGTFTRPSESILALFIAGGRGQDGQGIDGGNSGQFAGTTKQSPSIPATLSWAIDSSKATIDNGGTIISRAFHGVKSETDEPLGDQIFNQVLGAAGADNAGGGGAYGPTPAGGEDPTPGSGNTGGTGGFSYGWPGGSGGNGGDSTMNGANGANYMSGGGGNGNGGSGPGTGGAAICAALYYRNEAYA